LFYKLVLLPIGLSLLAALAQAEELPDQKRSHPPQRIEAYTEERPSIELENPITGRPIVHRAPNTLERSELRRLEFDFQMGKISEAQYTYRKFLLYRSTRVNSSQKIRLGFWKF